MADASAPSVGTDENAPATPSAPEEQQPPDSPAIAAPIGSLEEATPTDKGVLETQESVPQPSKKAVPSRRPPSRPDVGSGGGGGGGGGGGLRRAATACAAVFTGAAVAAFKGAGDHGPGGPAAAISAPEMPSPASRDRRAHELAISGAEVTSSVSEIASSTTPLPPTRVRGSGSGSG